VKDNPVFVLDANVFIQAKHSYYAFDLVPKFWKSLVNYAADGRVKSIDRVKQELDRGKDNLTEWANGHFGHAFVSTDEENVIQSFAEIMAWVQSQSQFSDAAKVDFANGADGWLVAYAIVNGGVVVTQEVAAPDARRKVPLPNVCQKFNVSFIDTFEMLRQLGVHFA